MVSKPTIGQTGWAVPLNAALDDLEARKLDATTAASTYVPAVVVQGDPAGVVDATSLIQAALASDRKVVLGAGRFKVSATIAKTGFRGLTISGAGKDVTYLECTAALAGVPVFRVEDYFGFTLQDMTVVGTVGSEPSAVLESRRVAATPTYVNRNLSLSNVRGDRVQRNVHWTAAVGADTNNDIAQIENCEVANFTVAAYDITHSNSLWHRFVGGRIIGGPIAWRTAGGSFVAIGTALEGVTDVEVDVLAGSYFHPLSFIGVQSEVTAKIIRTAAVSGLTVTYDGYRRKFATANTTAIDFAATASTFSMSNCDLELGQAGQLARFTSATSRAKFIGSGRLGLTTIEYAGSLLLVGNRHEPGAVTLINSGGTGKLIQIGDEGGGFTADVLNLNGVKVYRDTSARIRLEGGDVLWDKHLRTTGIGAAPSAAPRSGAGSASGATASVLGSDTAGTITLTTGTSVAAGAMVDLTFQAAFSAAPHIVLTPANAAAQTIGSYLGTQAAGVFTISGATAPAVSTIHKWTYLVIQ